MWLKTAKTSECDKIVICKEEKNIHFDLTQYIDYRLRLFFERRLLCSPRLHLIKKNAVKKTINIVKYYYHFK